jgi:hypothetical protein
VKPSALPDCVLRITSVLKPVPEPAATLHLTIVSLTHCRVTHIVEPTFTVGVASSTPKFMPVTVVVALPEVGEFGCDPQLVTTGALYENAIFRVPTRVSTFTPIDALRAIPCATTHRSAVSDTHDAHTHAVSPMLTSGV